MIHKILFSGFLIDQYHFPSDSSRDCTKNAKDGYDRSSFHRGTIRNGSSKDSEHERTNYEHDQTERNKAVLKITNKTHETVTFRQTEMIGVINLRSLGFYKIKTRGTPRTFRKYITISN